ncbi:hypothetical protein BP6252_03000 [Coleophoma cylindrospora]|uniref:Lysophospholipase A n=1 Tax=Coleophoma cylindrospora TaxID=1849047 RepID=A0A3D8S6I8_9HELO|nr:hypothetical protein BP6252_03000 [Coleophoma cylindrospora]
MKILSCLVVLLPVLVCAFPKNSSKPAFDFHKTDFLLAFGDSYTYVQGTDGRQNYSFIGDLFNYSYTPAQLLSDEIVQNQIGTSAGGPNWVEYLTSCFSGLPSKCRFQLWDFAFAGSDVSTSFTALHHNYTVSFENQVKQWASYAEPYIPVKLSNALVAIWIGINDIGDTAKYVYPIYNATGFPSLYNEIIGAEFKAIESIYDAGYKNYLFMNLPPLERTPLNVRPGVSPLPNSTMTKTYNDLISAHAATFEATHPGTKAMVFDTYTFLSGILDDPAPWGITNTTGYCAHYDAPDIATNYAAYGCLPIPEYFWYNTGHITYKVHGFVAEAVREFLEAESS